MRLWTVGTVVVAVVSAACVALPTTTDDPGPSMAPSPTQPDDTTPVELDPALLDILPAQVNGFEVTEAPDEAAIALNDPALPKIASGVNVGAAVDTGRGDVVVAWVVRLRPGAFSDDQFRQWRESFALAACAASGGVSTADEATIDGRLVHITNCLLGMRTYHVVIPERDLLISASSIGEARFGDVLMATLRVD